MAESQSMTSAGVVAKALIEEHSDFLRESVAMIAAEIMEAEIVRQIGAGKGEVSQARATHRNGYRQRPWATRVGEIELAVPRKRSGESYFSSFPSRAREARKALLVAFAVHESGRREVIGIEIAESETEAGWAAFLRDLRARGLGGVKLAVSDDHLGLKAAIAKAIGSPWQRCTVHFIPNMHGHCKKGQRNMVSAALREVFNAEDRQDAKERSASVIERLAPTAPKVAALLKEAEEDLLAFYRFPAAHWSKLRSTNNIERVNKEIARRSDVVGIFPNDRSAIRLVGALLIEQNDGGPGGLRRSAGESVTPQLAT